jgi:hypothetical protein
MTTGPWFCEQPQVLTTANGAAKYVRRPTVRGRWIRCGNGAPRWPPTAPQASRTGSQGGSGSLGGRLAPRSGAVPDLPCEQGSAAAADLRKQ